MRTLILALVLLPLFAIAQKKKGKEPVIKQPEVKIYVDPISGDTSYSTNIYRFWQDGNSFNLRKTKDGLFLMISFDSGGEYVPAGKPLYIKFANDQVLTIQAAQAIRPTYIYNSWVTTGAYLLDEKMIGEFLANDLKYIRITTSSSNNEWEVKEQDKDSIRRFLTAINK